MNKVKKREKRRLRTCHNSFPSSEVETRLLKLHKKIQREVGHLLEHYSFRVEKYVSELRNHSANEKHIKYIYNINRKELIPHRNKEIIKRCKFNFLGQLNGITPCGLKTEYEYFCYWCKFNYSKFSKKCDKLTREEIESIIKDKVALNV